MIPSLLASVESERVPAKAADRDDDDDCDCSLSKCLLRPGDGEARRKEGRKEGPDL